MEMKKNTPCQNLFPIYIIVAAVLIIPGRCLAQYGSGADSISQPNPEHYQIEQAETQPDIDGRLSEALWENTLAVSLSHEFIPEANAVPPVDTECYITYDRNNLYLGFKADDPLPSEIRAHLMERDDNKKMARDDYVGIVIDPFNNEQWGFEFRVNPMGVQVDAIYSDQRDSRNYSWDAIWESAGQITNDGYEVEIRIPFTSLNVPSSELQTWRFSAFRNYPRSVRQIFLNHPVDLDNQSQMAQFSQLEGFSNITSGLNLEINPTLTAKRTDDRNGSNNPNLDQGKLSLEPGGNLRWGIRPNINLSATVNPDFSQIEADALQLRENQRFVLSVPEKRPFFLEGTEIFETPMNAVFTRSIIQPMAGLKLTGRSGAHRFGTIITRDRQSRMLFPSGQSSEREILNQNSYSKILRYSNKITDKATFGILAEGRNAENSRYQNYVGGIDGYLQFWDSNSLQYQYLHSSTAYPEQIAQSYGQPTGHFQGGALDLDFNHSSSKWQAQAGYLNISSGFRNDNGFFRRAAFQTYEGDAKRIFRGSSENWFSSIRVGPGFELTTASNGALLDRTFSFNTTYNGPYQSTVNMGFTLNKQRFQNQLFDRLKSWIFFFRIQPSGILSKFRLYAATGDQVDFSNIREGQELIIHPGLTFNIGQQLNLELDPNFQRLSYQGATTFSTYLLGARLYYHFNKRTLLRSILQYRYVDRNLDQFNNPDAFNTATESFSYQLLFSYKLNPQSKFFLGFSSGYGASENRPLRIQNRTGFLKMGYAWVF